MDFTMDVEVKEEFGNNIYNERPRSPEVSYTYDEGPSPDFNFVPSKINSPPPPPPKIKGDSSDVVGVVDVTFECLPGVAKAVFTCRDPLDPLGGWAYGVTKLDKARVDYHKVMQSKGAKKAFFHGYFSAHLQGRTVKAELLHGRVKEQISNASGIKVFPKYYASQLWIKSRPPTKSTREQQVGPNSTESPKQPDKAPQDLTTATNLSESSSSSSSALHVDGTMLGSDEDLSGFFFSFVHPDGVTEIQYAFCFMSRARFSGKIVRHGSVESFAQICDHLSAGGSLKAHVVLNGPEKLASKIFVTSDNVTIAPTYFTNRAFIGGDDVKEKVPPILVEGVIEGSAGIAGIISFNHPDGGGMTTHAKCFKKGSWIDGERLNRLKNLNEIWDNARSRPIRAEVVPCTSGALTLSDGRVVETPFQSVMAWTGDSRPSMTWTNKMEKRAEQQQQPKSDNKKNDRKNDNNKNDKKNDRKNDNNKNDRKNDRKNDNNKNDTVTGDVVGRKKMFLVFSFLSPEGKVQYCSMSPSTLLVDGKNIEKSCLENQNAWDKYFFANLSNRRIEAILVPSKVILDFTTPNKRLVKIEHFAKHGRILEGRQVSPSKIVIQQRRKGDELMVEVEVKLLGATEGQNNQRPPTGFFSFRHPNSREKMYGYFTLAGVFWLDGEKTNLEVDEFNSLQQSSLKGRRVRADLVLSPNCETTYSVEGGVEVCPTHFSTCVWVGDVLPPDQERIKMKGSRGFVLQGDVKDLKQPFFISFHIQKVQQVAYFHMDDVLFNGVSADAETFKDWMRNSRGRDKLVNFNAEMDSTEKDDVTAYFKATTTLNETVSKGQLRNAKVQWKCSVVKAIKEQHVDMRAVLERKRKLSSRDRLPEQDDSPTNRSGSEDSRNRRRRRRSPERGGRFEEDRQFDSDHENSRFSEEWEELRRRYLFSGERSRSPTPRYRMEEDQRRFHDDRRHSLSRSPRRRHPSEEFARGRRSGFSGDDSHEERHRGGAIPKPPRISLTEGGGIGCVRPSPERPYNDRTDEVDFRAAGMERDRYDDQQTSYLPRLTEPEVFGRLHPHVVEPIPFQHYLEEPPRSRPDVDMRPSPMEIFSKYQQGYRRFSPEDDDGGHASKQPRMMPTSTVTTHQQSMENPVLSDARAMLGRVMKCANPYDEENADRVIERTSEVKMALFVAKTLNGAVVKHLKMRKKKREEEEAKAKEVAEQRDRALKEEAERNARRALQPPPFSASLHVNGDRAFPSNYNSYYHSSQQSQTYGQAAPQAQIQYNQSRPSWRNFVGRTAAFQQPPLPRPPGPPPGMYVAPSWTPPTPSNASSNRDASAAAPAFNAMMKKFTKYGPVSQPEIEGGSYSSSYWPNS